MDVVCFFLELEMVVFLDVYISFIKDCDGLILCYIFKERLG